MKDIDYMSMELDEKREKLFRKTEDKSKLARFGYLYGIVVIAYVAIVAKLIMYLFMRMELAVTNEALELATDSEGHIYSFKDEV